MSERYHWDGTPKDDAPRYSVGRTMWLHQANRSTALRRDSLTRCRYCGLLMEYFDRYDHQRIPMVPKPLPVAAIPHRMRWHIAGGVAYPGDGGEGRCFVPHPAFCPMVEHEDDDLMLAEARAAFRKKSEERIAAGLFIPRPAPARCEAEVAEQHVADAGEVRHVVAYGSLLWLAPGSIDTIRCVARAESTGQRCRKLVSEDEGRWEEVEIPYAPGRAGQQVLWEGLTMWVYGLHTLYSDEFSRWMQQRCLSHAAGYQADAVSSQWVIFNSLRHDKYILRERPAGVETRPAGGIETALAGIFMQPKRTTCATDGCVNGSAAPVPEGWICSECTQRSARRERTHKKWVSPSSVNTQGN